MTRLRAPLSRASWRIDLLGTATRFGVAACVAAVFATGVAKLNDVLGLYDLYADTNAAATYALRAHTYPGWSSAGGQVLEDARLWMPEDAAYRVVLGPQFDEVGATDFTRYMLLWFLLPRRPTESKSAKWVFCYGCDETVLSGRFRVLSYSPGGPAFGRVVP